MPDGPVIAPALRACGWRDDLPAAAALDQTSGRVVRVIEQHRSGYRVTDGETDFAAQAPVAWTRKNIEPEARAAVGDWVLLDPSHDRIERLLPRTALLRRAAAGEHYRTQLIAANVDTVFVVSGLDLDFNPRRLERYVMLARSAGSQPVIILTKRDLNPEWQACCDELASLCDDGVPIVALNARELAARDVLAPWTAAGQTIALLGSSGAGKSTLTNALLGIERQKTGAVRETDSRGRHTTTHRSLIVLPGGACLIDTPGMRELKLVGDEAVTSAGFADVEALAEQCRFRDCKHDREPGCAVQQALEDGELDPARWAQYGKLQDELVTAREAQEALRARRADEKMMGRALNKRLKEKYGRR
ncbi:MAG: ribosome small subunit-dependent GTPase A [Xanthomonadales bacterium]|nr:ribosome small subunit-dependent GTPase A [Xanthomonadales bacterium]